jgi:hypothetical protein
VIGFSAILLVLLLAGALLAYLLLRQPGGGRQGTGGGAAPATRPPPTAPHEPPRAGLPPTAAYRPALPAPASGLPAHIGRYRLLDLLGAGGMGEVYRAHDPQLDRTVALKLPRFDGPPQEVARRVERFQREARAAAQVWHPHVCPIFDVGEHEGRPFVVMALIEGQSLAQRLAERPGPQDARASVALARQVLDGLAAVHARGIVHRDLKPGNILLDPSGRAVLTDFGLARPEGEAGLLTSEGVILGTPSYMAPEQAAGQSDRIGPWTDLYSLGVVLYQLLTGRLPFPGAMPALLAQILRDEPPPPRAVRPDLDPALEAVVLRALRKEPAERYPDAGAFAAALDAWAAGAGPGDGPAKAPRSPTATPTPLRTAPLARPRPARFSWERLAGWLAGGVLVTVGMGLLALMALTVVLGDLLPLVGLVIFTPLFLGLGLGVLAFTEAGYVPEGLALGARVGEVGLVKRALANGVPADGRDEMGETPLMHAAAQGHGEVVKVLLLHGAGTGLRNPFGQTALEIAQARGHADIAALLQNRAAAPAAPPGAPPPRPSVPLRLLACAGLGGLLAVVLIFWVVAPVSVPPAELLRLLERKQVASVTFRARGEWTWRAEAKLRESAQADRRRLGVSDGKFTAQSSGLVKESAILQRCHALRVAVSFAEPTNPFQEPAPPWSVLPMLGVPLVVALLLGRSLGAPHWFPMLGRPRQPGARAEGA